MLNDKKIIVTGAASGIGREIVSESLAEGASVIACDINKQALNNLKSEYSTGDLYTYQIDVSNQEQIQDFFVYVKEQHHDVNSLVNNAGIYLGKNLFNYNSNDINKVFDINIKGFVYFTKFFGKLLMEDCRKGSIVNMSSVSGIEGSSDAIYGTSKAAILGLTKSTAMNFSPYIRVNAVAPTMANTPMMNHIPQRRKEDYMSQQLINEPLQPVDIANTVVFLISERARHYSGATFDLNNGCYLR